MFQQTRVTRDNITIVLTTDAHGSVGQLANGERLAIEGVFDDHESLVEMYASEGWLVVGSL